MLLSINNLKFLDIENSMIWLQYDIYKYKCTIVFKLAVKY